MADTVVMTDEEVAAHKSELVGMLRTRAENKWVSGVTDQELFKQAADEIAPPVEAPPKDPPPVDEGPAPNTDAP
jgi:hypothetical protein